MQVCPRGKLFNENLSIRLCEHTRVVCYTRCIGNLSGYSVAAEKYGFMESIMDTCCYTWTKQLPLESTL
jgi:hypothetical protein